MDIGNGEKEGTLLLSRTPGGLHIGGKCHRVFHELDVLKLGASRLLQHGVALLNTVQEDFSCQGSADLTQGIYTRQLNMVVIVLE